MKLDDMDAAAIIAEAARRAERRLRGLPLNDPQRPDAEANDKIAREWSAHYWRYTGPQSAPSSGLLEGKEQWRIISLLRLAGARDDKEPVTGKVYNLSQPRASKQTPGIPDVYAVFAAPSLAWRGALWIETKVEGGEISDEQLLFAEHARALGIEHVFGDVRAVVDWLVMHNLARYDIDEPHGVAFPARTP
jgi:hypothetical protein